MDISDTPTLSLPYVSPASEYVLLLHDPLHNIGSSSKNRVESGNSALILLNYDNNQPVITNSWDRAFHVVLIFRTEKT